MGKHFSQVTPRIVTTMGTSTQVINRIVNNMDTFPQVIPKIVHNIGTFSQVIPIVVNNMGTTNSQLKFQKIIFISRSKNETRSDLRTSCCCV